MSRAEAPRVVRRRGQVWVVFEGFEPGWTAEFRVIRDSQDREADYFVIRELRIFPTPKRSKPETADYADLGRFIESVMSDAGILSAAIIRKAPIRRVWSADIAGALLPREISSWLRSLKPRQIARRTDGRGRPPLSDLELAHVAQAYVRALRDPKTERNPAKAVAREFVLERSTARNRIHQARIRGLLRSTPMGRPGGVLTRKAEELLGAAGRRRTKKK